MGLLDLHLVVNSTELVHLKAARVRVIFMYVVDFLSVDDFATSEKTQSTLWVSQKCEFRN